jgi:hypothetical protein
VAERTLNFTTRVPVTSNATPGAVYDTILDLRAHLEWSGERADDDKFKLLSLEAPDGPRADRKQLTNLTRLAEERSAG